MKPADIEELNKLHALHDRDNHLTVKSGRGSLAVIEIVNSQARATIALQGAHLLSWVPKGEEDVLWLSSDAKFARGKSIRGGIPVCWPWFSDHENRPDFPAHGFARTSQWEIDSTKALENGSTRITFSLHPKPGNEHMWFSGTALTYQLTIGATLQLELITCNGGEKTIIIGQALHTYFKLSQVDNVILHGLDQDVYLDKLDGFREKQQQGPLTISEEVDRIYLDTASDCIIEDQGFKRRIIICKQGSHSTVVWNPWKDTADKMGDLGKDGYLTMLCVESANAATDRVEIPPGATHRLQVEYELQPLTK